MTIDLTKGKPMRLILAFGIPVLLGNLFQQLYNVADTAIVGRVLGQNALAAVGSTGPLNFLVLGFCGGVCNGFAIPAAQRHGAGDKRALRRYVAGGVWLTVVFAVGLTLLTFFSCGDILRAMHTPSEIYPRAYLYIGTIFAGLPAYFLYNYSAGVLRALGDSRTPVVCLVAASVLNIALDILFILRFGMDVFGAALATVLAQALAGIGCLVRLCRSFPVLRMRKGEWRPGMRTVLDLCAMGLPMGLQYSITAIGSVMLQSAVNGLGAGHVAAVTAAAKVSVFLTCPFDAMGATMVSYQGQNTGARQLQRVRRGLHACTLLGAAYALAALAIVLLRGEALSMLFLNEDSASLAPLCRQYLTISAAFYFPLALVNIFRFSLQGMGFSPLATLAGLFELAARGAFSLLVPVFGYTAACLAAPAAWVLADLFLIPAFFLCLRRLENRRPGAHPRRPAGPRPLTA